MWFVGAFIEFVIYLLWPYLAGIAISIMLCFVAGFGVNDAEFLLAIMFGIGVIGHPLRLITINL